MPRVAHRITPNRERELSERAWALAEARLKGRVICARCRATIGNYAQVCPADDDDNCPGDAAWEAAFAAARAEVGLK
jgi:hypothetical protein